MLILTYVLRTQGGYIMAFRDLFRGKTNQDSDSQDDNNEQIDENKNEEGESPDPSTDEPTAAETLQPTSEQMKSLTDVTKQYNADREALQNVLFSNQRVTQDAIDKLVTQTTTAQQKVDENGKTISKIQNEMESASQKASAPYVDQQTELNQKIKESQDQVGGLIDQVNDYNHEIGILNDKQQKLAQKEKEISTKFGETEDPADIVNLADQYRADIAENKKERDENAQVIVDVDGKRQVVKDQLQKVRDTLTANQKSLSKVNEQLEEVQIKIASDDEERTAQLDQLTNDLTKSQNELAQLQNQKDAQDAQLKAINDDIQNWLGVPVPVNGLHLNADTEIVLDMDDLTDDQLSLMKQVVHLLSSRGITHFGLYSSLFSNDLNNQIAKWTNDLTVAGGMVSVHNPLYNLQHQGELSAKYRLPDNAVKDEWNESHTERTLTLPDDGWKLKVHYFDLGDHIANVAAYKDGKISESSQLTMEGQLTSNRFYNDDGTINRDEYYRQDGLGILTVRFENNDTKQLDLLNPSGINIAKFDNVDDFTDWWLKNDFDSDGVLVGPLENSSYRSLVSATERLPIALVKSETLDQVDFKKWVDMLTKQQYIVSDYATEIKLVQMINQPLNVRAIDARNMPVGLSTPED